jgi:VPDSG-CTERM motif
MRKSVFMGLVATILLILSEVTGKAGTVWDIDLFFNYLSDQPTYTDSFDVNSSYDSELGNVTGAQQWSLVSEDQSFAKEETVEAVLSPSNASLDLAGGQTLGDASVTLDATGTLKYAFEGTGDDFFASDKSDAETSSRRVPDGGATLMLLGVALAAIEQLRRRMARRNGQPKTA